MPEGPVLFPSISLGVPSPFSLLKAICIGSLIQFFQATDKAAWLLQNYKATATSTRKGAMDSFVAVWKLLVRCQRTQETKKKKKKQPKKPPWEPAQL